MINLQFGPEDSESCYNLNILNLCYWGLGSYCFLVFTQENHCIVLYAQMPMTKATFFDLAVYSP